MDTRGPAASVIPGEGARDMRIEPEIDGVSIVLLGDFNPAIFAPAWFALHGLLPQGATDGADVQIVCPQVAAFTFDWLRLEVGGDRFFAETVQAPHVRLRDLVLRTFEHLPHTPLRILGINRGVHFRVRNPAERDRIGRTLAPVEPWGAWEQRLELGGEHGGMTSLTMSQVRPEGRSAGDQINITVEPSTRIDDRRLGVYVRVNDHYAVVDGGPEVGARLMEILENVFETSRERSDGIVDHVMSLANDRES